MNIFEQKLKNIQEGYVETTPRVVDGITVFVDSLEEADFVIKSIEELNADTIEKAVGKDKYGKGKKTVMVQVQNKKTGKIFTRQQVVGTKDEVKQKISAPMASPKINKNKKAGGGHPLGKVINDLIIERMAKTGASNDEVMMEMAITMGYKPGDAKSAMYKVIEKSTPKEEKIQKLLEYVGISEGEFQTRIKEAEKEFSEGAAEGKDVGKKEKLTEEKIAKKLKEEKEFNYDFVNDLIVSDIPDWDKAMQLIEHGLRSPLKITHLTGVDMDDIHAHFHDNNITINDNDGFDIEGTSKDTDLYIKTTYQTVEERFDGYKKGINMIVNGELPFLMAYGPGGVGKTFNAEQAMEAAGLRAYNPKDPAQSKEEYDYAVISGRGGMGECIKELYKHRDKILILDDYDSVIKPSGNTKDDLANVLKAAFDTGKKTRYVKHGMDIKDENEQPLEDPFIHTGAVIMITNLPKEAIPQPLISRMAGMKFDLSMSLGERIKKIDSFYMKDKIRDQKGNVIEIPDSIREKAWSFMKAASMKRDVLANGAPDLPGQGVDARVLKGMMINMYNDQKALDKDPDYFKKKKGPNWQDSLNKEYYRMML